MAVATLLDSHWRASDRLRALAELAIAVGLLEAELWSLRGRAPEWFNILVYAILVATIGLSYLRRQACQTCDLAAKQATSRTWSEAVLATAGLTILLLVAAYLVGDTNETFEFVFLQKPPIKLFIWIVGKIGAALGQQLALQCFLWPICRDLTRSRSIGMVLAASIFGLLHLPSPTLVAITLLAGLVWVGLYRRSGQLAPLVVSHLILATLAHGGLPERLTYDMRIGITAVADQGRFAALEDPKTRVINRRLKEHRDELRHFASLGYYQAQGGTDPAYIRALFRDIMGRAATDSDVEFWQGRHLANLRAQIPSIFLASDEFAAIETRRAAEQRTSRRR